MALGSLDKVSAGFRTLTGQTPQPAPKKKTAKKKAESEDQPVAEE